MSVFTAQHERPIVPPQDIAAEEAVLGSVLLSDVVLPKLIVDLRLSPDHFYRQNHARIWEAMVAAAMDSERVDVLTLGARLKGKGEDVGRGKLEDMMGTVPSAANVLTYARRVIHLAEWRRVQSASYELLSAVHDLDADRRTAAEAMLTHIAGGETPTRTPERVAEDLWRHLEGVAVPAWATPWPGLNRAMGGGLRAGEVTLLGGWTSHGKSVVTDQLLRCCAEQGAKVHLYINEMAPTMRALRTLSAESGVDQSHLAQPDRLTDGDRLKVMQALGEGGFPFGITQVTDWSGEDVARDMRFRGWDVCALDLVHRLPFREERDLAQISTALNAAAQASGAHLVAVVHLNEARAQTSVLPVPVLRDIRASGMLKNDADNVLFIHREEEEAPNGVTMRTNRASLYLSKCRNGYLRGVDLRFDAARLRFLELQALVSNEAEAV